MLDNVETDDYRGPDRRGHETLMIPLRSLLGISLIVIVIFNALFMGAFFLDQHNRYNRSNDIAKKLVSVQQQQQCVADAQSRWDAAIGDIIALQFSQRPLVDPTQLQALSTLKRVNDELKDRQVAACYSGGGTIPDPGTTTTTEEG